MKYFSSSILVAAAMATSTNTFFASSATIRRTVEASNLTIISSTADSTSSPYLGNYDNLPGVKATESTVAGNAAVTSVALNGADNAQDALANLQAPSSAVQVVGKRGGCGCDLPAGCC